MRLDDFPGVNAGYVFELYERFRQNPESVDAATRKAFAEWTPTDPGTYAAVAAALLLVALIASALPARRAVRVSPHAALGPD